MSKDHQIGDAPIQSDLREEMNELARYIDIYFNGSKKGGDRTIGFTLMVFPFNDFDGRCNYISSADPKDMIVLLKEQVARLEGRMASEPREKQ